MFLFPGTGILVSRLGFRVPAFTASGDVRCEI